MKRSICASGSGIGALLLDRVLRGHDDERIGQGVALVADGDLALLHGFEQRALHLGRRAVDFVCQHQIREDWTELGAELARLLIVDHGADQIRGQQVGRELHARELGVNGVANGAHRERLGQPWHALQEHVPPVNRPTKMRSIMYD